MATLELIHHQLANVQLLVRTGFLLLNAGSHLTYFSFTSPPKKICINPLLIGLGRLMSRHYLAFSTMELLTGDMEAASVSQLLELVCKSREMSDVVLR